MVWSFEIINEIKSRIDYNSFAAYINKIASPLTYMVIVGKREEANSTVSVRKRGMKNIGAMALTDLVIMLKKEANVGEVCKSKWKDLC